MVKTREFRYRGFVRVKSVLAEHVIINGFIEALDTIRAKKLLVVGGIKAKSIQAGVAVLNLTTPSTIIDIKASILRVSKKGIHGRLYCSTIEARKIYLTYTHVHTISAEKIVLNDGCVVDRLVMRDNCILRINTPYCSFRTNPLEQGKLVKIVFNYHNTSLQDPF